MTMTLVSTVTVGSGGAANILFTSIPQTGTDLFVVYSLRSDRAALTDIGGPVPNEDILNTFTFRSLIGNGAAASSSTSRPAPINGASTTSNTFSSGTYYIPNYSTSSTSHSGSGDVVIENNATTGYQGIGADKFNYTSARAVTTLTIQVGYGPLQQYSTASLYTITKGSGGATVS